MAGRGGRVGRGQLSLDHLMPSGTDPPRLPAAHTEVILPIVADDAVEVKPILRKPIVASVAEEVVVMILIVVCVFALVVRAVRLP